MKKLFILLLLIPFVSHATELIPYQPQSGWIQQVYEKVKKCTINPFCYFSKEFGSTITNISSTSVVADFPTLYNTNNSNLNTDKLESGSTASALTITTGTIGTLTLTNPLTVPYGGTASTTLSSNQVLLGNGTSLIKTVAGWGVSGQFLTSGGAGAAPSWTTSSVDLGINYAWTGVHNFAGSATYIKNLTASTTLTISNGGAGYTLTLPTSIVASSTIPALSATGVVSYINQGVLLLDSGFSTASSANNATTSLKTLLIPANTVTTGKSLRIAGMFTEINGNSGCYGDITFGNGTASTTLGGSGIQSGLGGLMPMSIVSQMYATTTSAEAFSTSIRVGALTNGGYATAASSGAFGTSDLTGTTYVSWNIKSGGTNVCQLVGTSVELLSK